MDSLDLDTERKQFGRYSLIRMIARGGMGEIYLARLQGVAGFEKTCVIKKIRPELASDSSFVERFLNEGRTLVALTHSNIVQIFDMGQVGNDYYLAMEYVPGEDLRDLMRCQTSKWMPIGLVIAVAQRVLQGLSYAHRAVDSNGQALGIVHRDISPSNILISSEGEVKIIDFGIAKAKTIESVSGVVQGKFAYMSPEQARGECLDCRTDIFSLGVVLYEMLTGIRPFEGNSDLQSLERIKNVEPKQIHSLRRDVDGEFSEIINKALAKNRDERYATADEFYDAIQAYAKKKGLDEGQREISAYFKPLMQPEMMKPVGIEDALDALLEAQELANLTTATKTITGKPENNKIIVIDINDDNEIDINIDKNVVDNLNDKKERIDNNDKNLLNYGNEIADSKKNTPTEAQKSRHEAEIQAESHSDSSASNLNLAAENAVLMAETRQNSSDESASSLESNAIHKDSIVSKRDIRRARLRLRLRYGIGGAIIFCILSTIFLIILFRVNTPERADEIRETLQNLKENNTLSRQEKNVWQDPGLISDMPKMFQRGIPFTMITEPENATIYIIEGGYRSLEEKSVILLPEHNVEIAIQAPGYETCIFQIHFDDIENPNFENISWQNCSHISTNFAVEYQRFEVYIGLNPIRAIAVINGQRKANLSINTPVEAVVESPLKPVEDVLAVVEPQPENSSESEKTPSLPDKTTHRENHKNDKKQTKTSKVSRNVLTTTFQSNIDGNIIIDGQTYRLPAKVESQIGASWKIVPDVSGRKIGVPEKGSFVDKPVDISFCEASVRIKESFVQGDPAPYQLSDIYIDGNKVASQKDAVQLVLTCGTHQLEAKIYAGNVRLSGKMSISVQAGKSNVFSLQLNEE